MSSDTDKARNAMVDAIAKRGGVRDSVIAAMRRVPRHELIPAWNRHLAYADRAIAIGSGATISQPYIVAFMTDAAEVAPGAKVLEIGTGSAYQALVLAAMGCEVYSVEIVPELFERAQAAIARLEVGRVHVALGDGHRGWSEAAPFDAIIVTAAPDTIPHALVDQLKPGGRLVIPVGGQDEVQTLRVLERVGGDLALRKTLPVRFIPLTRGDPRH